MPRSPQRIQLRRTKGWRKPEGAIVVTRSTRWGSPFPVGKEITQHWTFNDHGDTFVVRDREHAVELYERWIRTDWFGARQIRENAPVGLRGHDLACWCPLDQPCHADVLLRLANPKPAP